MCKPHGPEAIFSARSMPSSVTQRRSAAGYTKDNDARMDRSVMESRELTPASEWMCQWHGFPYFSHHHDSEYPGFSFQAGTAADATQSQNERGVTDSQLNKQLVRASGPASLRGQYAGMAHLHRAQLDIMQRWQLCDHHDDFTTGIPVPRRDSPTITSSSGDMLHCCATASEEDQAVVNMLGGILQSKQDVLRAMPPVQRTQLYAQLHLALVARQRGRARAEQCGLTVLAHRPLKCKSAGMKRTTRDGGTIRGGSSSSKEMESLMRLNDAASTAVRAASECFTNSAPHPAMSSPPTPIAALPQKLHRAERRASVPCSLSVGAPVWGMADRPPCGMAFAALQVKGNAGAWKGRQQVLRAQDTHALVWAMAKGHRGGEVSAACGEKDGCSNNRSSLEDWSLSTSSDKRLCIEPQGAHKITEPQPVDRKAVQMKLFGVAMTVQY